MNINVKLSRLWMDDTIDVDIDLIFHTWIHNERIRLVGIDIPESRTRDLEEKNFSVHQKVCGRILASGFKSNINNT